MIFDAADFHNGNFLTGLEYKRFIRGTVHLESQIPSCKF